MISIIFEIYKKPPSYTYYAYRRRLFMPENIKIKCEKRQQLIQDRLIEPLEEKTRIKTLDDIIGQEEATERILYDLRLNRPKNIALLGPDGIEKKDILRVCFKEIQNKGNNFFNSQSKFVEYYPKKSHTEDFINDTLFGSVYVPDGSGIFKIPRPKMGAVTFANKGIIYVDNIDFMGNKLIKKLVDVAKEKKVLLKKPFETRMIPEHMEYVFKYGFPADFCLAVTVNDYKVLPHDLLDMCDLVYFKEQSRDEIIEIFKNTAKKGLFDIQQNVYSIVGDIAKSGNDAINILQHAAIHALKDERKIIIEEDLENILK